MPRSEAELIALLWSLFWALPDLLARFWAAGVAGVVTLILVLTIPRV